MKTPKLLTWLAAAFFAFAPVSNAQESKMLKPFSQEYTAINSDFKEVSGNLVIEKLKVETARSDEVRTDGTRTLGLILTSDTEIKDTYIGLIVPQGFEKKDVKIWTQRRVANPSSPRGDEYRAANDSSRIPLENELNFLRHIAFDLTKYEQRTFGSPDKQLQGKRGDLKILEEALAANGEALIPLDYEARNCVQLGYRINYTLPQGVNPRISAIILSKSEIDKAHLFRQTVPFFTQEEAKEWSQKKQEINLGIKAIRDDTIKNDGTRELRLILAPKEGTIYETYVALSVPEDFELKKANVHASIKVINPDKIIEKNHEVYRDEKIIFSAKPKYPEYKKDIIMVFESEYYGTLREYIKNRQISSNSPFRGDKGYRSNTIGGIVGKIESIITLDFDENHCTQRDYIINYTLPQGVAPRICAFIISNSNRQVIKQYAPFFTVEEASKWVDK